MWDIAYLPEALRELKALDGSQRMIVLKGIRKVAGNPLPQSEGGYGKPLGSHSKANLTELLKIKFRDSGLGVVYKLERTETQMRIIVISARADEEAYELARDRVRRHEIKM